MMALILLIPIIIIVGTIIYLLVQIWRFSIQNGNNLSTNKPVDDFDKSTYLRYCSKIRGSVRLNQGRLKTSKDLEEMKEKIIFP